MLEQDYEQIRLEKEHTQAELDSRTAELQSRIHEQDAELVQLREQIHAAQVQKEEEEALRLEQARRPRNIVVPVSRSPWKNFTVCSDESERSLYDALELFLSC